MVYNMRVSGSNAAAISSVMLDFRDADTILGINWSTWLWTGTTPLSGTPNAQAQLSFLSTPDFTTNDQNGILSSIIVPVHSEDASNTDILGGATDFLVCSEKVAAGERIYLHVTGVANTAVSIVVAMYTGGSSRKPTGRMR